MYHDLFAKSGFSLDRLRTFCQVVQSGGITKAADNDPNRQSQYSRQLKELEEYFGTELFSKRGRGLVLTDAGERLAQLGHLALEGFSDFLAECRNEPVELSIGAGDSILHWEVGDRLDEIQKALPRASVRLKNMRTREIAENLQNGQLDFGIIRSEAIPKSLAFENLGSRAFCLFVPEVLSEKTIRKKGPVFSGLPLLVLDGGGRYSLWVRQLCEDRPEEFHLAVSCSSFPLMSRIVKKGLAAAFMPRVAAAELEEGSYSIHEWKGLNALDVEHALAWNPRTAAIRSMVLQASRSLPKIIKLL